ncbi:hypothetical protein BU16DRAFT_554731 [Lophium mytilinum]|uniref:Membrane anchor Opy2 N-terminal domain-containing protein n=1 Tax=Lophium mytilinum TaxID=390894 RepID=A0A6A6RE43_9PEZI|nr:hypothetical protein BU16DRAFT_554731 [Lophium mytilinum]
MALNRENVEYTLRTIFRRCVQCPTNQSPSCPDCPSGQICAQTPYSCGACASTTCIQQTVDPTNTAPQKSSGPNVGAIAGGVVGGVVFLLIVVFIVYKFCLKGRRQQNQEGEWREVDAPAEKNDQNDFASRRSARASTHTVASMASSVLTRASNIIQIAYIPGVTNRSGPGSPDLLVPPVPPIPSATSPSTALTSPYSMEDQHFFLPGELRDSTYSGLTDGRSSYARTSITPSLQRSSVATTIYRNNAIVSPLPAQTIVRGKAAVVSVKSSGSSSPSDTPGYETPPIPQIEQKHLAAPMRIQMPGMGSSSSLSPSGSIRSTGTLAKPTALNIVRKAKPALVTTPSSSSTTSSTTTTRPVTAVSVAESESTVGHSRARQSGSLDSDSESDSDDHSRARRSLLREESNPRDSEITVIQDTPGINQGPFADSASPDPPQRQFSRSSMLGPSGLETITEDHSSKRTSKTSHRTQSPFSDDNEIGR